MNSLSNVTSRPIGDMGIGAQRLVRSKLLSVGRWFHTTGFGIRLAYRANRVRAALKPNSAKSHELLGDSLLDFDRFDQGITEWRRAISLQSEDLYDRIYRRSVALLHRGKADASLDFLTAGIEAQEGFAREHQLDRLGLRFLREWTFAIGHMALLDSYVKLRLLGYLPPHCPVVLDARPANRCYLDYWRQYIPSIITDPQGVKLLTPLATRLEAHLHVVSLAGGEKVYHITAAMKVQEQWRAEGRAPLLRLSARDDERGRACLSKLGVPPGAWFVGLHVRDGGAGNRRDSNIAAYEPAIQAVVRRGGWVIRMGDGSMPHLRAMPGVIDYAHSDARCDWMDVFLWARCRFFVGTQSGPAYVPPTFGVPCLLTNMFPMPTPFPCEDHLRTYKLYWSQARKRYLTFAEAMASPVELAESDRYLDAVGIRPVSNTPEEIRDIVVEMLDRMEGKAAYSLEDERLQERFRDLDPPFRHKLGAPVGRVGQAFLRKYRHLL